ncbi:hypothetical protein PHYC_00832 [Phycisphaerales bacterium]|nr:hypothetical protein PHYC_00832 [Phycisphaerales bacterium]
MSALTFIQMWQASPFRPFRVRLSDGRAFEVMQAQQVAGSADLRQFVVMVEGGPVAFGPELVAECEVLGASPFERSAENPYGFDEEAMARLRAGGVDPSRVAQYKPDPGGMLLMGYATTDRLRFVQFAIKAADGRMMLTTLLTRWNLVGVESFENGRTLYLVHADDPLLQKRVIVWPPDRATFESFAEAAPVAEIQRQLNEMDEAATANPRGVDAAPGYLESVKRRDEAEPSANGPSADRFKVETDPLEVSPHRFEDELRLAPAAGGRAVFDLFGTGWYGSATLDPGAWSFELKRGAEPECSIRVKMWPGSKLASVERGTGKFPLWFVEPLLRNYGLHEDRGAFDRVLLAGPRPHTEPQIVLPLEDGYSMELWAGEPAIATPFLHPRLVGPRGLAILDLRGTAWGAMVETQPRLRVRLINRDESGRYDAAKYRLHVDLAGRCVTSPDLKGSMALGALHGAAHASRVASMLVSRMEEAFSRGRDLVVR